MKAVVTVIGKDMVGILAGVSTACCGQIRKCFRSDAVDSGRLFLHGNGHRHQQNDLRNRGTSKEPERIRSDMVVHVMHEDIFNSMHRI